MKRFIASALTVLTITAAAPAASAISIADEFFTCPGNVWCR
ncbi:MULTISPECIES: hypothetical protein [Corynebacterium]|nr:MULTISPECIES: hypothetical protein [Corynebacterium]WKD64587.1 hypothetical protein CGLUCO_11855 [Corynebacterium glucuronolyticum DSM 44120]SMB86552.1 hypothetical protein SAMN05660745_01672 [Corynebacterium glucuronolyticum]